MADMRSVEGTQHWLGGPYAGACLYLRRSWMREHRRETQQMVQALVRALRFIGSHPAAEIVALLPQDVTGSDRAAYTRALTEAQPAFSPDGTMPPGAPQTVLNVLTTAGSRVSARHVDLSQTWTDEFVTGEPPPAQPTGQAAQP
jgi:NitT/TauT family transport system substrate-binding protein